MTLWGSGKPRREFVYSDDMADACIHLMNLPEQQLAAAFNAQQPPLFNIGHGKDQTIRELAEVIRPIVKSDADIIHDRSKPDGTPQRLLDTSKLGARLAAARRAGRRSAPDIRELSEGKRRPRIWGQPPFFENKMK